MAKTKTAAKAVTVKTKAPSKAHIVPVLKADDEGVERCSLCRRPFFPNVEKVAFSFKAHIEQNHMEKEVTRQSGHVAAPQEEEAEEE
jgi:hypothetical protein